MFKNITKPFLEFVNFSMYYSADATGLCQWYFCFTSILNTIALVIQIERELPRFDVSDMNFECQTIISKFETQEL
jgi:hypothetical protein